MRSILAIAVLLLTTGLGLASASAAEVGVTTLTLAFPKDERGLMVTLWYPAGAGATAVRLGENAIFEGVEALQGAPFAGGPFPLVLLSHGGYRSAPNHGDWIGAALAARGYLVAAVRGPKLGPRDAARAIEEIWRRPLDLSATLSVFATDSKWSDHLDATKIGAVGFFVGGTAVVSLAGAELDAARFAASCDPGGTGIDCDWFAASGVDLHKLKMDDFTRPKRDPRIKLAVAVDPELGSSFAPDSLAAIALPLEVVNLGASDQVRPGLKAEALAAAIPEARYHAIADATPYSAFGLCTEKGAAILKEEGENEALCLEPGARGRAEIHAELVELIGEALERGLSGAI